MQLYRSEMILRNICASLGSISLHWDATLGNFKVMSMKSCYLALRNTVISFFRRAYKTEGIIDGPSIPKLCILLDCGWFCLEDFRNFFQEVKGKYLNLKSLECIWSTTCSPSNEIRRIGLAAGMSFKTLQSYQNRSVTLQSLLWTNPLHVDY